MRVITVKSMAYVPMAAKGFSAAAAAEATSQSGQGDACPMRQ